MSSNLGGVDMSNPNVIEVNMHSQEENNNVQYNNCVFELITNFDDDNYDWDWEQRGILKWWIIRD
jgi:hypothetical protein